MRASSRVNLQSRLSALFVATLVAAACTKITLALGSDVLWYAVVVGVAGLGYLIGRIGEFPITCATIGETLLASHVGSIPLLAKLGDFASWPLGTFRIWELYSQPFEAIVAPGWFYDLYELWWMYCEMVPISACFLLFLTAGVIVCMGILADRKLQKHKEFGADSALNLND